MTIIAGFKSYEGIVLCADTQETVGDAKRSIPKLRFEPNDKADSGAPIDELAVAFCGAGNNGVFMDEMVDRAWEEAQGATSLDQACELIKRSIKIHHKEAKQLYFPQSMPDTELIYGVKMHRDSRLFYALGPSIIEKSGYATGGLGLYLADFLASRMYREHLNMRQCVILAAYVLFEAKEHVNDCGGDSHIAILREDGPSGRVDWHRIEKLTELLKWADDDIGKLLLDVADLESGDAEFRNSVDLTVKVLEGLRDSKRQEIRDHASMVKAMFAHPDIPRPDEDEYGFAMPSDDQKEEPEQ